MTRALLLLGIALSLSSCVATQADVLAMENQADNLKAQITDLKATITSMQANQADLSVQMKQLHEDLNAYTETSKANQDQMSRLASKLDDMSAGVKSSVASIGSTLSAAQAKGLQDQAKSLEEQKAELEKQAAAGNPTDLFNTADVRLQTKSFALAAKGFEEYVGKFPKGALIDVAIFKLGQAYYGERKWESAGRQFGTVLEKYPKSEMTASSRLLYAMCLISMKKSLTEARQYLESIPNDFPTSPEAKAAARELKKLSKKGA
jgi:TolA-binding protein